MRCPYCGGPIKARPEFSPLSFKKRMILNYITEAGPQGVTREQLKEKFFAGRSDIAVRTTMHYINNKIKPMRLVAKGGLVRLAPHPDDDH